MDLFADPFDAPAPAPRPRRWTSPEPTAPEPTAPEPIATHALIDPEPVPAHAFAEPAPTQAWTTAEDGYGWVEDPPAHAWVEDETPQHAWAEADQWGEPLGDYSWDTHGEYAAAPADEVVPSYCLPTEALGVLPPPLTLPITESFDVDRILSPRAAATPSEPEPEPEHEHLAEPVAAGPVRTPLRRHGRTGILVGSVALLAVAGGAMVPNAVARLQTAPVVNGQTEASPTPSSTDPATEPADRRVADRADRSGGRAEVPAPASPTASATPAALRQITVSNVAGIPDPCSIDVPITDDLSAAEITARTEKQWGLRLTGPQWQQDQYRPIVKLFAETMDSVDCTDYLNRVKAGNGGTLEVSSLSTSSWAWGDYGLTRPNVLTLDFAKFRQGYAEGDRGRLVRLIIHEMAHSLNADRFSEPRYWTAFSRVWAANGPVSAYGSTETESFADAVGYYVARCAADSPYDTRQHKAYYDYVRDNIFGGREFGGAVGTPQTCAIKGR